MICVFAQAQGTSSDTVINKVDKKNYDDAEATAAEAAAIKIRVFSTVRGSTGIIAFLDDSYNLFFISTNTAISTKTTTKTNTTTSKFKDDEEEVIFTGRSTAISIYFCWQRCGYQCYIGSMESSDRTCCTCYRIYSILNDDDGVCIITSLRHRNFYRSSSNSTAICSCSE